MAISAALISLGLDWHNAHFGIPSGTDGWPSGWASVANVSGFGGYSDGSDKGQQRYQLWQTSTTGTHQLTGPPASPYLGTVAASTKFFYALRLKTAGVGGSNSVTFGLRFQKADGSYNSDATLATITTVYSSWTQLTGEATITPGAATLQIRPYVSLTRASGTVSVYLEGFYAGVWQGSTAGYYTTVYKFAHPGTWGAHTRRATFSRDYYGRRVAQDVARHFQPRRLHMAWNGITDAMRQQLSYAWRNNAGSPMEANVATANPAGGVWPVLVVPNAPGMPPIIMGDFAEAEDPFQPVGDTFWDPPLWGGALTVEELD